MLFLWRVLQLAGFCATGAVIAANIMTIYYVRRRTRTAWLARQCVRSQRWSDMKSDRESDVVQFLSLTFNVSGGALVLVSLFEFAFVHTYFLFLSLWCERRRPRCSVA